jgi:predicted outer membrane repeat protein
MFGFNLHLNQSRFTHILVVVLLCLLLALFNSNLFAASAENEPARSRGCSVQGEIIEDTLWSPSDCNPYLVTGSLVVIEEITLTIEPGTTVKFDNNKGLTIHGTLVAQGTSDNMITFTGNQPNPAPGDWAYIYFSPSIVDATFDGDGNYSAGSVIQYALIEYAGGATVSDALGAVRIEQSAPFIDNNTIRDNRASGISAWNGESEIIHITNNLITENVAQESNTTRQGAGIYLSEVETSITANTILSNTARNQGGGIYIKEGIHVINDNLVENNHSTNSHGGGLYVDGTITIEANTVISNTADDDGGGLFLVDNNTLLNNVIENNTAFRDGGGVMATNTVIMTGNTISNNRAYRYGGGVVGDGDHIFTGNTIKNNIAALIGGGIFVDAPGTDGSFTNNVIIHNQTTDPFGRGGGIYLDDESRPLINNNDIYGNQSDQGQAIYNANSAALVNQSLIDRDVDGTNNYWGTTNIDAIEDMIWHYFDTGSLSIVDFIPYRSSPIGPPPSPTPAVTPTPIAQCEVAGWLTADTTWSPSTCNQYIAVRSVVVPENVTLTIEPGTLIKFSDKKSLRVEGMLVAQGTEDEQIIFTSNLPEPVAGDWGYIYFTPTAVNATFDGSGNYIAGSLIQYAIIEYAAGTTPELNNGPLRIEGSAPFIDHNIIRHNVDSLIVWDIPDGLIIRITNNEITDNGGTRGGGLYVTGANSLIGGNTIMDNHVSSQGGGIWISGGTHTITDNTIMNNSAGSHGGGGYINAVTTIANNMVISNTGGAHGGGLYLSGEHSLSNNTLTGNTAGTDAGGLYLSGSHSLSNNTITDNRAGRDGGGIFIPGNNVSMINNIINDNHAFRYGGGVVADGDNIINYNTIDNNLVDGNTSDDEEKGGGLYFRSSGTSGEVSNNIITNNRTTNPIGEGGGIYFCNGCRPILLNNDIYDNQSVKGDDAFNNNIHTLQADGENCPDLGGNDVDGCNNWWGTTDENAIEEAVWHYWDNASLSELLFEPWCTGPCAGTPTPTFTPSPVIPSKTPLPTWTPTITPTPTNTLSPTATNTPGTPSLTLTPTATNAPGTPSLTPTPTATEVIGFPTFTATPTVGRDQSIYLPIITR